MASSFPRVFKKRPSILQVNLGYKCNQACNHCHVDASPSRTEMMSKDNIELIPKALESLNISCLDITGGAPELHPDFKYLIRKSRKLGVDIIDRCNLTILQETGYEDLSKFLALYKVKIVASLPCYEEENVDSQRGIGVFQRSIASLVELNKLGYGQEQSDLILDLVYNPLGAQLPPSQKLLEQKYRKELLERYGIRFNNLFVITNMPIKRFANQLRVKNELSDYKELLKKSFNPKTLDSIMCLETISVDWEGNIYDCDFNQQIGINDTHEIKSLKKLLSNKKTLEGDLITVDDHCFGCTAGSGSSCGGELT
ncbi:arsenosugar biosynthesis radical SAM (seleno)protein ArsS [Prochlorococcus marinus]|uniref:Predicted Fe-S oxidoreductase n=1 Tax=Prochlorococcus marinus (strain MIT 9211) TaxID=93059 RepID=A9BA15_PROM4|nr:arsenosugar biosynthesis radical SAM (seleno)protein ArsS [Prochlorococcus marinus]ABX08677.1 Predicted Fe-S oxidoreductase [Prochlorococcus marinus str. MIT 9211]